MAKRRVAVIAVLLCFCFCLMPCYAQTTSTSDASEPIDISQDCTFTITCAYDETVLEDVSINLYKIADVSADFQYTLTSNFVSYGLILNGIQSIGEWNAVRSTLEAHIIADNLEADSAAKTDSTGKVCFETLKPGLYLATVGSVKQGNINCCFDSALVALPNLASDGLWQYQVALKPKSETIPPDEQDVEFKILKLWKGDEGKNSRPKNIEVEIFRDGVSYKKVVLSQENNWSYVWVVKEQGSKWTVVERNIPSEYTMTVENRNTSFILTNTFDTQNPDYPSDSPLTGDTMNIMFYVILMIISASMLIVLGITRKRNTYEETK